MRLRAFPLIFIYIILVTIVQAGVTLGPSPNNEGDLGLVIVASHTPEYIKEWLNTPSSHGVTIKRLTRTKPDQLVIAAFLVTGFTPDADHGINVNVSFSLIGPDNKVVFEKNHYASAKGKAPDRPTFVMADPAVDIVLEKSDLAGVYTIIGIVEDEVSKKSTRSEYKIELIK